MMAAMGGSAFEAKIVKLIYNLDCYAPKERLRS